LHTTIYPGAATQLPAESKRRDKWAQSFSVLGVGRDIKAPAMRSDLGIRKLGKDVEDGSVRAEDAGYYGQSPLHRLKYFPLHEGLFPDAMHCISNQGNMQLFSSPNQILRSQIHLAAPQQ